MIEIPGPLPATIIRSRALTEAIMTASLREQGPCSRTASAWRWVITGSGPAPISHVPCSGHPPDANAIVAETRHDSREECSWPLWLTDPDPDRRQARRVLRWLDRRTTGELALTLGMRGLSAPDL